MYLEGEMEKYIEKYKKKNKCHICDNDFEQLDIHFLEYHSAEINIKEEVTENQENIENSSIDTSYGCKIFYDEQNVQNAMVKLGNNQNPVNLDKK